MATFLPVSGSWRTRSFHSPVSRTAAARLSLQMDNASCRLLRLHSPWQLCVQMLPSTSGKGTFSRTTAVAFSHSPALT